MAYSQRRGGGNSSGSSQGNRQNSNKPKSDYAFQTGLFQPKKEGVKRIAEVFLKEAVTIPAGSYLHLYENDKEGGPVFSLAVSQPAK